MKKNWKETLKLWLGALLFLAESAAIGCKKLPKKAVALCVAAALIVAMIPAYVFAAETTYDVWVGGVQVTSANKDNIVVPGAIGSATYDPDTQTLTLNNFSYTGLGYNHYYCYNEDYGEHYYSYAAIYSKNKLIIKLVGNNTVFCEGEGAGLPSFCSVYTEKYGDLTICDDTTDNAIGSFSANKISSYGNLTIRDVNVTAQYRTNALYSAGDLWIQNATVMATSESGAITCYGDITMEDSIVTATSTNTGEYDRGILYRDTLTVKNSIVEMIGGKASESLSASTLIPTLEFDIPFVVLAGADKASAVTADSSVDATYTGKYVKITPIYKVTFDYGSFGNETVTVIHGECVEPATPVFAGKVLVGWYADSSFSTEFNFSDAINANKTIYAKFADYEGDKKTLQDAIDALETAVGNVETALNNKVSTDKLTEEVGKLNQAIADAKTYADTQDAALKTTLEAADATMNAAITELQNRVTALETGLTTANGKIDTNTTDINTLKTNVSTLETWKTEAQNAITALQGLTNTQGTSISALQAAVADLQTAVSTANSNIAAAEARIAVLEGKVTDLETATANLQNAVTALQAAVAGKADTATVNAAIANLQAAIAALEAVKDDYATADAALKTELEGKIATAKSEAISAAETLVNNAKTELQSKIDAKADAATTTVAIQNLQAAVAALEAVKDDYATADAALKTELEGKISAAQTAAISAAETLVSNAKAELQSKIDAKADAATTTVAIQNLQAAVAALEAVKDDYATADAALKTELEGKISAAQTAAISAAETLVNNAKSELQSAIDTKADAAAVNAAIANLQNAITALQNAKDNYIAADAALKAELEEKIAKAKQEAIDAAKGHIPYIGTNGNWWIGDTDTGVDANGIKGDTGNGIASITTKKENGVTTVTITFTDPEKEPVVFTISDGDTGTDGVGVAKVEKTATNGNVDTYTITLTNGKTYTFTVTNGKDGADGKDGTDGKDGENGKDGLTPFIGENGNWWIGDTDTGVKAVAEQTAQKGTDTITVVSIVAASVALLSNLALVVWIVTKKKKVLM